MQLAAAHPHHESQHQHVLKGGGCLAKQGLQAAGRVLSQEGGRLCWFAGHSKQPVMDHEFAFQGCPSKVPSRLPFPPAIARAEHAVRVLFLKHILSVRDIKHPYVLFCLVRQALLPACQGAFPLHSTNSEKRHAKPPQLGAQAGACPPCLLGKHQVASILACSLARFASNPGGSGMCFRSCALLSSSTRSFLNSAIVYSKEFFEVWLKWVHPSSWHSFRSEFCRACRAVPPGLREVLCSPGPSSPY